MNSLRTIVVDDCTNASNQLIQVMNHNCPQVEVIGSYNISPESLVKINNVQPDLVFFDVGRPNMRGLDLLSNWDPKISSSLVLTDKEQTERLYSSPVPYLDYLVKPAQPGTLKHIVQRASHQCLLKKLNTEVVQLKEVIYSYFLPKLGIPTLKGIDCIPLEEIIYIEASDNYSILYLTQNRQILSSLSLGKLCKRLSNYPFIRIHRRFLINISHIQKYIKGDGGQVRMSSGTHLNVARNRKEALIAKICMC